MCPVTLTAVGVAIAAAAQAAAAAAAVAATAVGTAVSATAGFLGISTAALVTGTLSAAIGIAASVHSYNQEKKAASLARKHATAVADQEITRASNEAARATKLAAEENLGAVFANARTQGSVSNLQNRGSMQLAALTREVSRGRQTSEAVLQTKLQGLQSEWRTNTGLSMQKEKMAYEANRGPSKTGLAIGIGTSILGAAVGAIGTGAASAAKTGLETVSKTVLPAAVTSFPRQMIA